MLYKAAKKAFPSHFQEMFQDTEQKKSVKSPGSLGWFINS